MLGTSPDPVRLGCCGRPEPQGDIWAFKGDRIVDEMDDEPMENASTKSDGLGVLAAGRLKSMARDQAGDEGATQLLWL